MNSSHSKFFPAAILLALFAGPQTGVSAEAQVAKTGVEAPVQCQKKFGVKGRPHRISTVATLTAVRAWAEHAKTFGKEYAMWNEAENGTIKCEKLKRSDYYLCFASGKPCRAKSLSAAGSKTAG